MAFLGLETLAQKGIFVAYISLWIGFGLLNQHAKSSGIEFHGATAVLLQSILKIILSTGLFLRQDGTWKDLFKLAAEHRRVFVLYAIPAALYAAYDVLSYVNLKRLDAPTYFLLLRLSLPVTAIIHQLMFRTSLNRNQWIALLVVTAGCSVKTIGDAHSTTEADRPSMAVYGLVMAQIVCSTSAGVYNEVLLKGRSEIPLNLQNVFMYLNSVMSLVGMLALGLTGQTLGDAVRWENFKVMFHPTVFAMVILMSLAGVVTSVFLKLLDSVRKGIAASLELVVLPIFSAVFFNIPIMFHLVCAVAMVSSGICLYSMPVDPSTAGTEGEGKGRPMESSAEGGNNSTKKVDVEQGQTATRPPSSGAPRSSGPNIRNNRSSSG